MKDRFEATFSVDLAPTEVWSAIARRTVGTPEETRGDDAVVGEQVWLPGFDGTAAVLESAPNKSLRMRKDTMPCEGTEIAVTLEAEGTGTRITIVQSGFGAFFDIAANLLGIGWDMIIRDLALYVERGVIAHRHFALWGPNLGARLQQHESGLIVHDVTPDTLAARVGLQPDDHLISISKAPVVNERDLAFVLRALKPGSETQVAWLRGRAMMSGSAAF
jgi:hypothetical protein